MIRWCALVVLAGCYGPSVQSGLPCSDDGSCPPGQACDLSRSLPTCEAMPGDGGKDPDGQLSCSPECAGTTPICDPLAQSCRGCVADAECSSDVCHELTAECVPEGRAIYLAPGGTGATCTRSAPCASVAAAVNQLTPNRNTIKLAAGTYTSRLDLRGADGSSTIVLSGPDRSWDGPRLSSNLGGNQIAQNLTVVIEGLSVLETPGDGIESHGSLTLSRVLISGSRDSGLAGRGPTTRILDSRIEKSGDIGVLISGGIATIERTVISVNLAGGLSIDNGAGFSVVNTIIASNGSPDKPGSGVRISGGGQAGVFRFNTIAGNRAGLASIGGVECNRPVMIESSILANPASAFGTDISPMCSARNSLFERAAPIGNLTGAPMFVSATDFHIAAGSPAIDAASVVAAPSEDIDGDPRTGAPDIGADERL